MTREEFIKVVDSYDVVIWRVFVRRGDDYWEAASKEGVVAMDTEYETLIKKIKNLKLSYIEGVY